MNYTFSGDSSPIAGFLKKNANGGIHHVCIEVDDIEAAVRYVKLYLCFFHAWTLLLLSYFRLLLLPITMFRNFRSLKAKNVRCLSETTRIGAHGKPVMFLHPKDCGGVLTELEQA